MLKSISASLLLLLFSMLFFADTYDTHTLVEITVKSDRQTETLYLEKVDIVGRTGNTFKALLTKTQMDELSARGFEIKVLYDEMEKDRRLWQEADAAAKSRTSSFYYTASTFNMTSPPAGSLMDHLLQLYNAHPDICRLYSLGSSQDGAYDIIAMKVTKNPDVVEAEPKIRIYANIHGDEKSAEMVACDVLDTILAGYSADPQDPDAKKLVDESEMWFIPMGNPWGNANNTRYNSRSVDLNRNFWGPNGSDESPAWSENETQVIRDLTETSTADHSKKRFTTSISFHSGSTCFNSVWNYTTSAPPDEPLFWSSRTGGPNGGATPSADGLAEAYENGCTMPGFWYTEGADWYVTRGDTNDWAYGMWGDLDTTIEVTTTKTPSTSEIPTFCTEHRQAVINYMLKTFQGIHGVMTDCDTGAPLDGTVDVTCTSSSDVTVPHDYVTTYTDQVAGDFHRVLQPGTYTMTCHAPGYGDTVVSGLVVTADTKTVADCLMCKTALQIGAHSVDDYCASSDTSDGTLDAGEEASLVITLNNTGTVDATGVTGTLSTSSPGVTITDASSAFNDVPAGGSAQSVSPHLAFSVDPSISCGTVLTFKLDLTSAEGSWSDTLEIKVGNVSVPTPQEIFSESFDSSTFPPSDWAVANISGTVGNWKRATTTSHPTGGSPHTGAGMAAFNSFTAASGNSTILKRTLEVPIPAGSASASLSFWMYHDTGYTGAEDRIQVQTSNNHSPWSDAGDPVYRNDGSSGWKQHAIDLSAHIGEQKVRVAFLGISDYGNDCYIDDAVMSYTPPYSCSQNLCATSVQPPGETAPGEQLSSAVTWSNRNTLTWPPNTQAIGYRLYRGTGSDLPATADSQVDSCMLYEDTAESAADSAIPASGQLYWYLVTGTNSAGEGTAGDSSAGPRTLNSQGACPD